MNSAATTNESDPWLERHLSRLGGRTVFEIGCGGGRDTRILVNAGCGVDGLLLCRLNSTNDVHYGARGHDEIEPDYYSVDGQPKRFFDRATVDALFAEGWNLCDVEERTVMRYTYPKVLWEIVATKAANDD